MSSRREDVDDKVHEILTYLGTHTYDETAAYFNTSRGKVYSLAVAAAGASMRPFFRRRGLKRRGGSWSFCRRY